MKKLLLLGLLICMASLTACEKKKCSTKKCCNKCKTEQCCCKHGREKCCEMCKK